MSRPLRVALIFGGRSAEREVSLVSARTIARALDPAKYEVLPIRIEPDGRWRALDRESLIGGGRDAGRGGALRDDVAQRDSGARLGAGAAGSCVALTPDGLGREIVVKGSNATLGAVDLLFPVLHGPFGEDGSIQGLARMADLPCVGADLLGSALCMDKDAAKRIMRDSGIAVAPFRTFRSPEEARAAWPEVEAEFGRDLFVKPANLGSSVGVSRVRSRAEYEAAAACAFEYDLKIVVEKRIEGREIEVAVLGYGELRASLPGEVVSREDFYSYEAKYIDEEGAIIAAPASLTEPESEACRALALEACAALCVSGMARVDMFLLSDGSVVANEVNTIPGFTSRSMYPLLWEASGLGLGELADELVAIALRAHEVRSSLRMAPPAAIHSMGGEGS